MLIRTSLLALDQAARLQFNVGDGLDLWLDDRRLGARQDDRDISIRLTGENIPDDLIAIHVLGQIGSVPLDLTYKPEPNLYFRHVWDGTSGQPDAPGSPSNLVTEINVGWEMAEKFPRPHRTRWWVQQAIVGGVDLRSLGCGGISPDVVHHFDVSADILWRGNGTRVTNAREDTPRHLSRLAIKHNEIGIADGRHAHIFDPAGRFKRTVSMSRGHELASARTDEQGRVSSWTSAGHRYTIDRRNDSEAMLRSPAGVWAVIDFDDRGRAVMVTDQDKSKATLEWTETGGLARVVDSAGLVTEIERDELGRVTRFADSTGRQLHLVRNELPTGSEVRVITAEGRETVHRSERLEDGTHAERHSCCGAATPRTIEHRSLGPLGTEQVVRTPDGTVATTRRSIRADKLRTVEVNRTAITTPAGKTLSTERRTERLRSGRTDERLSIGTSTTIKRLDPKSHSVVSRSAAGRDTISKLVPGESLRIDAPGAGTLEIEFDVNGRPHRRTHNGAILTFGYDQNGRITWTDFERWRQHLHHDEQGRVNAIETPDGWLQIARDAAGRVIALQTPAGTVTSIGRRPDGLISKIGYPAVGGVSQEEHLNYDRDGLLVARIFSDDHHIEFHRDAAGRVANVTAPGVKVLATYDDLTGHLTEVSSVDGDSVAFNHDGGLQWLEQANGRVTGRIERAFDNNHRVVARRVNGGSEVRYARDADGLISSVGPIQIERSSNAGLPVGMRLGGLTTSREFDASGRLTRHQTSFGKLKGVFLAEEIERDDFGRVSRITETSLNRTRTIEYDYNEARRLAQVRVDGTATMVFDYDANGNITELVRDGRAVQMRYDEADHLVEVAGQPTSHDVTGNFTGIGQDGAVRAYEFDGLGRFVGSRDAHHQIDHTLDAIGRPIRISGSGLATRLLWDGGRLAATLDAKQNIDIRFIDSGTGPAPEALIRNGVEYLLVADHLGSIRAVVNAQDGSVVQQIDYDALGRAVTNTAPGWQPFGFAGGLHETVGGLVRFRARTYDPFIGRFLSRDPLGFAGGQVNLYQYALGDPVNNSDPSGMLVGPTGEINGCRDDFISGRPLSADHLYLQMDEWTSDMRPLTGLGSMGRVLTEWTAASTFAEVSCEKLASIAHSCGPVDDGAPSRDHRSPWSDPEGCFDIDWSPLAAASNPAAWEFDSSAWDDGVGIKDQLEKLSKAPQAIKGFLPNAKQVLVTLADAAFD